MWSKSARTCKSFTVIYTDSLFFHENKCYLYQYCIIALILVKHKNHRLSWRQSFWVWCKLVSLMIYYSKIGIATGIDLTKNENSRKCLICWYWYLIMGLNFRNQFVMFVMTFYWWVLILIILLLSLLKALTIFVLIVVWPNSM